MEKITHISADKGKIELWCIGRCGKLAIASSDYLEIAIALSKYGFDDTLSKSSSFDFGEEVGFETDDAPSKILDKAFEIYHLALKFRKEI